LDISNYIESGVLDAYGLGSISEQDKRDVEGLSKIYPEINEELHKIQRIIEEFAKAGAIIPPEGLKTKILKEIESIEISPAHVHDNKHEVTALKVAYKKSDVPNLIKYWSVAATILLVGFVAWSLFLTNKVQISQNNYLTEQSNNESLQSKLDVLSQEQQNQAAINAILASTSTTKVKLSGTSVSPNALVSIFWDTASKKVLLKTESLPIAAANQQYQLWAIVDGKPVDMGMLPIEINGNITQMMPKTVVNAQAFAITLEKKGGSSEPTLTAMYVVGNVKS